MSKIKPMLTSVRFWLTVLFAVAAALGYGDYVNEALAKGLEIFAIASISIRQLDKFATAFKE